MQLVWKSEPDGVDGRVWYCYMDGTAMPYALVHERRGNWYLVVLTKGIDAVAFGINDDAYKTREEAQAAGEIYILITHG